ncbi:MAG: TolC family protein [Candidatus Omnitrophica bacterium]|nr:TolC family protein [Candidatus Omnitrophota bacterium]
MKRIIALVFCVFLQAGLASAETLSWNDCLKEARLNHPDLVSAREKLNAARADKDITRSGALAQVTASGSADTGKIQGKKKADTFSYGVSGRQLLFDGFKTSNDLAAAEERIKSAGYSYQVTSSNVRLNLWTAFVGLLSAQENRNVAKSILERRKQNLDLVSLQYQGGSEHKGSLLTAEANEAQAELDLVEAERNVELYQRRLIKEMGRASFTPLSVSGDLTVTTIDRTKPEFEKLVEITPLLKELVTQKEAARLGVKSARSDFFPQVYANGGLQRNDAVWPPRTDSWSAGLSISFPVFLGGQQQAALSKAQANYRQSLADERSGRDGVIFTLAQTWTQWQNDVDQEAVQQKFFQAAKLRADIVEGQYKSGLATFNDWTIIEDDLVRNQKALLQAKTNALLSEAGWFQAKGETVDE